MSGRPQTQYECSNCGHTERKWLGRCPDCGEWNTLAEVVLPETGKTRASGGSRSPRTGRGATARTSAQSGRIPAAQTLGQIHEGDPGHTFHSTGIAELDRVLGGGLVPGASVLVGGEPGIGKSTLMLQMAAGIKRRRALYVTGEEGSRQIAARARRLGLSGSELKVVSESQLERILLMLGGPGDTHFDTVVIDSIQTLHSPEAGSVPGSPNQIKFGTFELADWARETDSTLFLVAHVTKDGTIAGPKIIEHMVDTVLYFEQSEDDTRFLRATKNRFGSTDEIGIFLMQPRGLVQVSDPNSIFLVRREGNLPAGVAVAMVVEGSRVLLVEVQALTVPAKGGMSRVFSDRLDSRRVNRMAAVLEKHLGLQLADQDIYVNVAGGMRIADVAVELPLAMALYSARSDQPLPVGIAVAGEVSLAGEVRPVPQMARRARTAREMGMDRSMGPAADANNPEAAGGDESRAGDTTSSGAHTRGATGWTGVQSVRNAVKILFG